MPSALDELAFRFEGHRDNWVVGNEKIWMMGRHLPGRPVGLLQPGTVWAPRAVPGDDLIEKLAFMLAEVVFSLGDETAPLSPSDPRVAGVTTTIRPDRVEQEVLSERWRIASTLFAPRGSYGFLWRLAWQAEDPGFGFALTARLNPSVKATTRGVRWDAYYLRDDVTYAAVPDGVRGSADGAEVALLAPGGSCSCAGPEVRIGFSGPTGAAWIALAYAWGADGDLRPAEAEARNLLADPLARLADNEAHWEDFFQSTPPLPFEGEAEKRLRWHFWCSKINYIESHYIVTTPALVHHRSGCYCRMFSWDTYFGLAALSRTNMAAHAGAVLKAWLTYNQKANGRIMQDVGLEGRTYEDLPYDFGFEFDGKARLLDVDGLPLLSWLVGEMGRSRPELLDEVADGMTVWERTRLNLRYMEEAVVDPADGLFVRDHYLESGWDNRKSPLFDRGVKDKVLNMQVFWYMSLKAGEEMAQWRGLGPEAQHWAAEAQRVAEGVREKMWCPEHGCYEDMDVDGNLAHVLCSDTFLPLLFETDLGRRARLLELLHDPEHFALPYGMPSLAASDPDFDTEGWGWQGNFWVSQLALLVYCLEQSGGYDEARRLLEEYLRTYHPLDLGEHNNPITGEANALTAGPHQWHGLAAWAAERLPKDR